MTTSTQLIAWLQSDNAKRCVLIEAGVQIAGIETTRFLSNKNYDTYLPVVCGGVTFSESLSLDGSVSLSNGNIEFNNINGEIDSWLDDVWKNRSIRVYIGDEFWQRSDFYLIFDGVVAEQPSADDRMKITLTLSDKLQRLNTTVSDVKLKDFITDATNPNYDKLIPLLFGECFNITPLLIDNATHTFQIHNGPIERIIEVRDNGIPVNFTPLLSTGSFQLLQQPVGTITCDAQGDNSTGYVNDPVGLVRLLTQHYGDVDKRFTDAELYLTSDISAELPGNGVRYLDDITDSNIVLERQSVPGAVVSEAAVIGVYLTDKTNLLDLCNRIVSSIGARVAMTRTGLLYVVRIQLPQPSTGTAVTAADMRERSLHVATVPVVASVQLGYCKNYTTQAALQTGLPTDQISLYAKDWPFTSTYADNITAAKFKLIQNPTMVETCLQVQADADLETARRGALFGVQRYVATYEGTPNLLLESLGSPHFIQHRRFSLQSGRAGQLINLQTSWLDAKVTLSVLI